MCPNCGELQAVVTHYAEEQGAPVAAVARFFADMFRYEITSKTEGE